MLDSETALLVADLAGVAVFAASGGGAAVAKRLDIFGVVFVGCTTALGGGVIRDLAIDTVPPLAFKDWRYAATALAAALLVFWLHPQFAKLRRTVLVLDAAGMALFTITGTLKAMEAGVPDVGAALLGMLTSVGGGLGRDLLTGEIPVVLRKEIYAVVALSGALVVVTLVRLDMSGVFAMLAVAVGMFAVRMVALRRRWSVPVPRPGAGAGGQRPD